MTAELGGAFAQQPNGPDDRYRVELWLRGAPINGARELADRTRVMTDADVDVVLNNLPRLPRSTTFAYRAFATGPDGVRRELTKTPLAYNKELGAAPRIQFRSTSDCLRVQQVGVLEVATSPDCPSALAVQMMMYLYHGDTPVTYNTYVFKVE